MAEKLNSTSNYFIVPVEQIASWLKARNAEYVKQAKADQSFVYKTPAGVWYFVKPTGRDSYVVREQMLGATCKC